MRVRYIIMFIILLAGCEDKLFDDKSKNPEYIFDAFWNELDRNYSFFEYLKPSWDSVYGVYKPLINENTNETDLFQIFTRITDLLNDAHTNIFTPRGVTGNIHYFEKFKINQLNQIIHYFDNYLTLNKIFDIGTIKSSNIGYIRIKTFDGTKEKFLVIDSILENFETTNGLIIDVRSNRGGLISNCEIVAGRLTDTTRYVCKFRLRNGPGHNDFSDWVKIFIFPEMKKVRYYKPVVLLTNRFSYSATEWFVMFADVLPHVTIIGDTTGGGSAVPIVRELPNGWLLRTSNSQTIIPSGRDFQCTGLYPDIPVWIKPEDASKEIDTILETAIAFLTNL